MELKQWSFDYAHKIAIFANNNNIANNLRNIFPHPYSKNDAECFIKHCLETGDEKELNRAIIVDGVPVGSISLTICEDIYSKTAELGYWVAEEYWGRGIATNAIKEVCRISFEYYNITRIQAVVYFNNRRSCNVLEKCGFTMEGILRKSVFKNGQSFDSYMYSLINSSIK